MTIKTHKLLLICTGNTCRSQMAHAMLQARNQSHGLGLNIKSRGIRANADDPTTPEALSVLKAANIDWQGTSQILTMSDLEWADDVWGMTQEHLDMAIQLGIKLAFNRRPRYQLMAGEQELLDPLHCGLEAYQQLFIQLQVIIAKRLAGI